MIRHSIFLLLVFFTCLFSCRKKDLPVTEAPEKGSIQVKLKNVVGAEDLVVGSKQYDNGIEQFSVSLYNYYISNIVLTDEVGNKYAEPESYHLAIASNPSTLQFSINDVPKGNYISVDFLIGVDSVRNFSGAQSGALDPANGMIWDWNTGYIMAKMEGNSPQSKSPSGKLIFHIAGFKAPNSVIRKVSLSMPQKAIVNKEHAPVIHLQSDLDTWFKGPGFPGFAALSTVSIEGPRAVAIADNYAIMFSITGVDN